MTMGIEEAGDLLVAGHKDKIGIHSFLVLQVIEPCHQRKTYLWSDSDGVRIKSGSTVGWSSDRIAFYWRKL